MKFTLKRFERWVRIAEVEAVDENEAREKFDDGNTVWDETIYVEIMKEPTTCERH